ncbi:MAG: nucleotide exchange factor GrpE [Paramuribaculum sp.]|nr:nucleotide exchange factor GrpE [Paramuribaculum sp.]
MSKHHNYNQDASYKDTNNAQEINDESEIMDNVPEAAEEGDDETTEQELSDELQQIDALAKQLAEEKVKLEKEKKEYLFLMAEFDNFRKRTLKEKSEIIRNAAESAMKGLLPIVDDFERGLDAVKNATDPEAVKEGMQLIYNKLIKYLESNGVKAIESTGTDFDPEMHEAIAMVPVDDESQKGKVIDTPTKGYTINGDKVLRYAKVAVGQ